MLDKRVRSVAKTVTWRIIATLITIGGVYVITGNVSLSFEAGVIINLLKALIYYMHERAWEHVSWGRVKWQKNLR